MSDNKAIKFPAKHYIGFQARPSVDELPLAFMTPDGTDKAAEKRKATVDAWAKGYGYDGRNEAEDKLPAQSYENKPMIGFKMGFPFVTVVAAGARATSSGASRIPAGSSSRSQAPIWRRS
jgi:hypothetical protein